MNAKDYCIIVHGSPPAKKPAAASPGSISTNGSITAMKFTSRFTSLDRYIQGVLSDSHITVNFTERPLDSPPAGECNVVLQ